VRQILFKTLVQTPADKRSMQGEGNWKQRARHRHGFIVHTEDGGRLGDGEGEELGDLLVGQRDSCRLLLGRRLLRGGVGSHGKERVVA